MKSGFRKCGISPCDVQILLDRLPDKDRVNLNLVGESFIQFVEGRRQELEESHVPRKRKATNIVAGSYFFFSPPNS